MSEDSPSLKAFILGDPPNAALSQCVASVTAALGTSLFDVRHFDWSSLAGISWKSSNRCSTSA
jgi:hypothetical protein